MMMRILFIAVEAAAACVFLLPLMLMLHKLRFQNWMRTVVYFLFALYLSAMWALVGLPNVAYMRFEFNINLIPFSGIIDDLTNSILNVLLFIPLGFSLPLLWDDFRSAKQAILWGLCLSVTIELLQILTYRATDINDLLTNTLGTGIGWISFTLLSKKQTHPISMQSRNDLWILLGCVFVVMFFMQPYLSNGIWSLIY